MSYNSGEIVSTQGFNIQPSWIVILAFLLPLFQFPIQPRATSPVITLAVKPGSPRYFEGLEEQSQYLVGQPLIFHSHSSSRVLGSSETLREFQYATKQPSSLFIHLGPKFLQAFETKGQLQCTTQSLPHHRPTQKLRVQFTYQSPSSSPQSLPKPS